MINGITPPSNGLEDALPITPMFLVVGTVYKMKVDACHVQFFDDPLTPNGGPKTIKFLFKDLRRRPTPDLPIPKPQLMTSPLSIL